VGGGVIVGRGKQAVMGGRIGGDFMKRHRKSTGRGGGLTEGGKPTKMKLDGDQKRFIGWTARLPPPVG